MHKVCLRTKLTDVEFTVVPEVAGHLRRVHCGGADSWLCRRKYGRSDEFRNRRRFAGAVAGADAVEMESFLADCFVEYFCRAVFRSGSGKTAGDDGDGVYQPGNFGDAACAEPENGVCGRAVNRHAAF